MDPGHGQPRIAGAAPTLTWAGVGRGAFDLAGAAAPVAAFGLGFGATAVEAGLPLSATLSMSALVFAGASQYAALELLAQPEVSLVAVAVLTLAVNARHLVLGATLHGYLSGQPALRRHAALALLSDANWAATRQAIARGETDLGHLLGGGLLLWVTWVAGTLVGALCGRALGDLGRFGIDVVMPAFFACALVGLAKARGDLPAWALAAALSGILSLLLAVHWAVLAGTLAGAALGALRDGGN